MTDSDSRFGARRRTTVAKARARHVVRSAVEALETRVLLSTVTYIVQGNSDTLSPVVTASGTNQYTANTLRAAINAANSQLSPVVIDFNAANFTGSGENTIGLTSGLIIEPLAPATVVSIQIVGPTSVPLIISGDGLYTDFTVVAGVSAEFDNLEIALGVATVTGADSDLDGGGITTGGPLTLVGDTFVGNTASAGHGGAVYSGTGQVTITNSQFISNSALNGGAIYLDEATTGVTPTITGSTLTGDTASTSGGAIYSYAPVSVSDTLTITDDMFSSDTATTGSAGGLASTDTTLTISGTTFSNDTAPEGSAGGVFSVAITFTVTNSVFTGDTGYVGGGGIYFYDTSGTATVTASTFTGDIVTEGAAGIYTTYGGGLFSDGTQLTVTGSTFATDNADTAGGGLYSADATLNLSNSLFSGDASSSGGALEFVGGTLNLTQSSFTDNSGTTQGGAIDDVDSTSTNVFSSTFNGNSAGQGGAIDYTGVVANFANDTLFDNAATTDGGGIYLNPGTSATVTDSTIDGNTAAATSGGGIYVLGGNVTLDGTIVAANTVTGASTPDNDLAGTYEAASANDLIGDGSTQTGFTSGTVGGNIVGTDSSPIDPMLGSLASNGGPTMTQIPATGSPAIGSGAAFSVLDASSKNITATDQTGLNTRPETHGYDIGAYETGGPDYFVFVGLPTTVVAGHSFTGTVEAITPGGTIDTTFADATNLTSSDTAAVLNPSSLSFTNGHASFTATLNTTPSQTLTVTDKVASTAVSPETSDSIAVTAPVVIPDHFIFVGLPGTATAGQSFNGMVEAITSGGTIDSGFADTAALTSSDAAAVLNPTALTFNNGKAFFRATLNTSPSQTLTVADSTSGSKVKTVTSASIAVTGGVVSTDHFIFAGLPTTTIAGHSFTAMVEAITSGGSIDTSFTDAAQLSSSDGAAVLNPASLTFTNGKASFTATLNTTPSQTLTVTDTTSGSGVSAVTSSSITVTVDHFIFVGLPTTTIAGRSFTGTVEAITTGGVIDTGFTDSAGLTSSDSAAVLNPSSLTFTNGKAAFTTTLNTTPSQTLTVTDTTSGSAVSAVTSSSIAVTVDHFIFVGLPTTAVGGASFTGTVEAITAGGTIDTGFTDTTKLTSSDSAAVLNPSVLAFTNGKAGFTATLNTTPSQTLTVTDTATGSAVKPVTSTAITVAVPDHFVFVGVPTSLVAGHSFSGYVEAITAAGKVNTSFSNTAKLTCSASGAVLTPSTLIFSKGEVAFTATLNTKTSQTLTVTDTTAGSKVAAVRSTSINVTGSVVPTVSISSPAAVHVPATGTTTVKVPVTLTATATSAIVLTFGTEVGTATGANGDYAGVTNATYTIPAGSKAGTYYITINSVKHETAHGAYPKYFYVKLSAATNATVVAAPETVKITLDYP